NRHRARSLPEVAGRPDAGCLADSEENGAPRFSFRPGEQNAVRRFLRKGDFAPLKRRVVHEMASHDLNELNCSGCHGKVDGVPTLSRLGGKLKPEWMKHFLEGGINYKPRPWLAARMPSFPAYASRLAAGLAALHGFSPHAGAAPVLEEGSAKMGARLVSAAAGFACVACHAVGNSSGGQVVESPGVNLAYSGERLQKAFFQRWVMSPALIDPTTKMPSYFDAQGKSQLLDFYEGDGGKQIEAIWDYLRLGSRMPAPPIP
ncbi:MAG TPA: hypothetical protein VK633_15075, partial [Verrucomicrobiae bacterium]|nr:hypothetical protein [Verrucomicrobiae bacterium]